MRGSRFSRKVWQWKRGESGNVLLEMVQMLLGGFDGTRRNEQIGYEAEHGYGPRSARAHDRGPVARRSRMASHAGVGSTPTSRGITSS